MSSETSVPAHETTRRRNPKQHIVNNICRENLKTYVRYIISSIFTAVHFFSLVRIDKIEWNLAFCV
jgi:hypothetical protein